MRLFRRHAKTLTLGSALALGLGFAGPLTADADYTFREPKVPNQQVEENLPMAKPTGEVGETGTTRSNRPYAGEEIQEQMSLSGDATGEVGEVGTPRENLPTEDRS